jgi:hypothetical protein
MSKTMVRYKVKPERAAENEQLIRAVYEELHRTGPHGIRYTSFRLEDGVSFVHIAFVEEDAPGLPDVKAFREFTRQIEDRCDEQPSVTVLHQIGAFGFTSAIR